MPTEEELDAALEREFPYLMGYPQPMIRTLYLRVADGNATEEEKKMVQANHIIWEMFKDDAIPPIR